MKMWVIVKKGFILQRYKFEPDLIAKNHGFIILSVETKKLGYTDIFRPVWFPQVGVTYICIIALFRTLEKNNIAKHICIVV